MSGAALYLRNDNIASGSIRAIILVKRRRLNASSLGPRTTKLQGHYVGRLTLGWYFISLQNTLLVSFSSTQKLNSLPGMPAVVAVRGVGLHTMSRLVLLPLILRMEGIWFFGSPIIHKIAPSVSLRPSLWMKQYGRYRGSVFKGQQVSKIRLTIPTKRLTLPFRNLKENHKPKLKRDLWKWKLFFRENDLAVFRFG